MSPQKNLPPPLRHPNGQALHLGIIGLGYVGLPLALAFGRRHPVWAYDSNAARMAELASGHDSTRETSPEDFAQSTHLRLTHTPEALRECNVFIIAVPTPVDAANRPDLQPLLAATEQAAELLCPGDYVIYESTVYPGVTESLCAELLARRSGLAFNRDFFVGYSPERVNPADRSRRLADICKITSGSTPAAADFVDALYRDILHAGTWPASSIRVAEAAKLVENTQRDVNIALMNELAQVFNRLGLDTVEVLEAAGSKWNFMPFRPGLVGGHCVGVDAWYLAHAAEQAGTRAGLVLAARAVNDGMATHVAGQLALLMAKKGLSLAGARVLVLGFTFKESCPDIRNTRVFDLVQDLTAAQARVDVYDPWADPAGVLQDYGLALLPGEPAALAYDAIVVAVAHPEFAAWGAARIHGFGRPVHLLYDLKSLLPAGASDGRL
ncbi:MAG: nucleotide sugar dehydrogenase [Burkholderiaceae bacterium]|nr:nucleotide sugar dehydrogenase [Burkholderiaceae bacterium]